MQYVDGFIIPVPKAKLKAYKALAKTACKVWMDHGALDYRECAGEDTPKGKITSFPRSVKLKAGEIVVFSWITYKSRKHRDAVMAKVMKDPRMQDMMKPGGVPFDGKRMIYGGFETFVSA